jgi:beta-glucosidase
MEKFLTFPKGFLWGSSISSYQTEGGIDNCDWSYFFPAGKACDHYNRYEDDFDLVKRLNQNAFRFSLEWSRIEPKEGEFDQKEIDHYKKVLISLRERGIVPFVTLNHWTLPLWFVKKGGWLNPKSPDYFSEYVKRTIEELGRYSNFWITLNEPLVYTGNSYLKGEWPPQKKSFLKSILVTKRLIRAHNKSYSIIKNSDSDNQVSISKHNIFFDPYKGRTFNGFLAGISDYLWNDYFLGKTKDCMDFIGLNYYFRRGIKLNWLKKEKKKKEEIITDLGWEVYPEGIYKVLKDASFFKKPIYITENGLADAEDKNRKKFIKDHLKWIHRAIEEGVDVRGYFHWSLMDNLEWDKGFWPRFGLVEIDYDTMARIPRPSAFYYADICKKNKIEI